MKTDATLQSHLDETPYATLPVDGPECCVILPNAWMSLSLD